MTHQSKRLLTVTAAAAVTVAAIGVIVWQVSRMKKPAPPAAPAAPTAEKIPDVIHPMPHGTTAPATAPAASQPTATMSAAQAKELFLHAKALKDKGDLLGARAEMSRAFFSNALTAAEQDQAIADMEDLAKKTLFNPTIIEGDPYVLPYVCKTGDMLEGRKGIEQANELHVPARLILTVNGLARGEDIRPNRTLKLVKGPFHAIVYKSRYLMDIYLQREGLDRVFIKRLNVGLGKNGSTPVGSWRVLKGGKMERPPYDPSPGSGLTKRILWGEPGYAFGQKGLWIALEGTEERTSLITGFGIHSTNDPNSIGKANSLGCVRMADDDIEEVYSFLYDFWSTVQVLP